MLGETIKTLQKKSHLVCDFFYKQKISCLERDVSFFSEKIWRWSEDYSEDVSEDLSRISVDYDDFSGLRLKFNDECLL